MFYALKSNLRSLGVNGFIRRARRVAGAALLSLLLSVAACAYTVVLKSGKRKEIPSNFIVTSLTLTYEAAPGLNITLLISTIDIAATERANNEAAGSLLKRAERKALSTEARSQSRNRRRELTQADIEKGRLERQKSEEAYERRRVELGLPSLEEARRRTEEETKRLVEESSKYQANVAEWESHWRGLATQLRTEMVALDAEINYVRARLAESPNYSAIESYAFINGTAPRFWPRRVTTRSPTGAGNPGFMRGNFGGRVRGAPGIIATPLSLYGLPTSANYGEQANLISRLHELEAARAGFQARWRLFEEEARRAGAQPGWLRP